MTAALVRLNSRTFSSFRYRNYRLFFGGQAVSQIGSWMQRIALGWFVFQLTHSAFAVGVMASGDVPAVHAVRPVRRRVHRPARRAPHGHRHAGGTAPDSGGAGLDRARRDRAAVDAVHDRVHQRVRARARRPVAPAAHVPDGRTRRPAECDRAQLEPVQCVARVRSGRCRNALRLHRRRRVLPRQRDQLPRGAAQPVRDADARLLSAGEVRAPRDLARHTRRTGVRAPPAQDARDPRADGRARARSRSTSTSRCRCSRDRR